jgi:hypothetical protein
VYVSGIKGRRWLKECHVNLLLGHWPVLDASWHNDEFTLAHRHRTVAKLHKQVSLDHQKQLVFVFMIMPHKGAKKLDEFHLLAVEFPHNTRPPVVADAGELLLNIYLLHPVPLFMRCLLRPGQAPALHGISRVGSLCE